MALILAVDDERRSVERIRYILGVIGCDVEVAPDAERARALLADRRPSLVLVAAELPESEEILRMTSRRNGGPGAIALVAAEIAARAPSLRLSADEILNKPFGHDELRQVIERWIDAEPEPAAEEAGEPAPSQASGSLSSNDIFADVVSAIEDEVAKVGAGLDAGRPEAEPVPEAAEPLAPAVAEEPSPPAEPAVEPEPAESEPAPAVPPRDAPARSATRLDGDVERRLQETLSGVFEMPSPSPAGAPAERSKSPSAEVDDLLADTLAGLELGNLSARVRKGASDSQRAPTATEDPPATEVEGAESRDETDDVGDEPASVGAVEAGSDEEPAVGEAGSEPAAGKRPPVEPPRTDLVVFGPYLLEEKIGTGGMAEVWKARRQGVQGFQKTVAIKRILPHLADDSSFVTMFVDEAKLAAQLSHDNIAQIFDLGKLEDSYYIAMEYVEGNNLRSVLNAVEYLKHPFPMDVALLVARALADALAYAHNKKDFDGNPLALVHRDVSPHNILLSYDGAIKLCDFGIAKAAEKSSLTKVGALKGKLQYMSPEQAWGKAVDQRTDTFSLGSVLFEMLAGRPAFVGDSELAVLEEVRQCEIPELSELRDDLPEGVVEVVRRAMSKEVEDRYQSAAEMGEDLRREVGRLEPVPGQATVASFVQDLFWGDEWSESPEPAEPWSDSQVEAFARHGDPALESAARGERDWLPWVAAAVVLAVVVAILLVALG